MVVSARAAGPYADGPEKQGAGSPLSRILVFAQNPAESAELVRGILATGHRSVAIASTSDEALDWALEGHFDVALVDVCAESRAEALSVGTRLQNIAGLRVVYAVAASDDVSIEQLRGSSSRDYLTKPLRGESLMAISQNAVHDGPVQPSSAKRLRLRDMRAATPARAEEICGNALGIADAISPSERRLRVLLAHASDIVSILDRNGLLVYDSPAIASILGYPSTHRVGSSVLACVHIEDRDHVRQSFERAVSSGDAKPTQYRIRHLDGTWRVLETVWKNLLEEPAIQGVLARSRDITERKALEGQLAHADRLANVGMLAAAVGHEINNPLTYVLAYLDNIAARLPPLVRTLELSSRPSAPGSRSAPPPPQPMSGSRTAPPAAQATMNPGRIALEGADDKSLPELAEQAQQAASGAHRIADIVRDLRTFVRGDTDTQRTFSLESALESAVSLAENQIRHRAHIVRNYAGETSVLANANRLVQVFLNLLTNAIHALPEDRDDNEIRLRTWTEHNEACAEVRDTGCGIPAEHLARLFDPFFTTKPIDKGTGLGLSISRGIVESYAGRIEVQSEVGRGTRFVVRLPSRVSVSPRETPSSHSRLAAAPRTAIRVLVVDDEPLVGSLMRRMLAGAYQVSLAESVSEAKKALATDTFDVVVCDMMMPDGTGMSLHEHVMGTNPALADKMIFVTGGAFTDRARQFFERVPNVRLDKPFDATQLKKAILKATGPAKTQ